MDSFRPDKFSFTLILSSPARLTAELGASNFALTHAWPTFGFGGHDFDLTSRYSRNFFALTFRERERTPSDEQKRQPPNYRFVGDYFAVFLCIYFGKRFDNHGFLLDHGHYCLPHVEPPQPRKAVDALPFTSKARKDLEIPLRLDAAAPIVPILDQIFAEVNETGSLTDEANLVFTAGRFYQQALQQYDADPELSFLSLVNAGEVLVSGLTFSDAELHDEELTALLYEVDERLTPALAAEIKKKFCGQISRKFRKGLAKLLNATFFLGSESARDFLRLKPETIEKHLRAAYDLRSKFLHAGTRFGSWVVSDGQGSEISIGTPAYGSKEWKKLITDIPTLDGLERVIRFALLRFIHQRISPISPLLE